MERERINVRERIEARQRSTYHAVHKVVTDVVSGKLADDLDSILSVRGMMHSRHLDAFPFTWGLLEVVSSNRISTVRSGVASVLAAPISLLRRDELIEINDAYVIAVKRQGTKEDSADYISPLITVGKILLTTAENRKPVSTFYEQFGSALDIADKILEEQTGDSSTVQKEIGLLREKLSYQSPRVIVEAKAVDPALDPTALIVAHYPHMTGNELIRYLQDNGFAGMTQGKFWLTVRTLIQNGTLQRKDRLGNHNV